MVTRERRQASVRVQILLARYYLHYCFEKTTRFSHNFGMEAGSGTSASLEIQGIGNELYNGSPVEVHLVVFADRESMFVKN